MNLEGQKRAAGEAAVALIEDGMIVGLGTGSTAAWFVRALAARRLAVRCVATSTETERLASELGLALAEFDDLKTSVDITIDGADEIGPGLGLIKGAGGALLREKLVWTASRRCVVIADASKPVARLGRSALPVEVARFGHETTARRLGAALQSCGVEAQLELRSRDAAPFVTDGGNLIYDAACGVIETPRAVAEAIKSVTGVVEHGLFLGLAERALIGTADGVETLWP